MSPILRIATRKSPLAMWQAEHVQQQLQQHWPHLSIELVPMSTSGDHFLRDSLAAVGGKGLFVKELEHALLNHQADVAVHSLKDVPAHLPEGLSLTTFLNREDPRDALVSSYPTLSDLPHGACVGTASLRRQALLKHHHPHLQVKLLRGNVNTRLSKLAAGEYDAIILAAAGLKRLDKHACIQQYLAVDTFVPAVGQGVLALECRHGDEDTQRWLQPLHHCATASCVLAERAFNERLGGACHVPVAGHAVLEQQSLRLTGVVAHIDGQVCLKETIEGPVEQAQALGIELAQRLLAQGAQAILQAV